jgi:hypothetical protein
MYAEVIKRCSGMGAGASAAFENPVELTEN